MPKKNTLFNYFAKKRKKPCSEYESVSHGQEHSSVESQENISRMSMSVSDEFDENNTSVDLNSHEELNEFSHSQTIDVHNEPRSEMLIVMTADESEPCPTDLDSHLTNHENRVQGQAEEPRRNDPSRRPSFFDNKEAPCQPNLKVYPGTRFGSKLRRFNSNWYSEYKWLEYNQELDACFCFPCRMFLPNPTETTFTKTGYRDWKHAKEKGKGFDQHQSSNDHTKAKET